LYQKTYYYEGSTERKIIRWIHIIVSIPIIGYIYGPLKIFLMR